jgi:hypothetical protein
MRRCKARPVRSITDSEAARLSKRDVAPLCIGYVIRMQTVRPARVVSQLVLNGGKTGNFEKGSAASTLRCKGKGYSFYQSDQRAFCSYTVPY